MHQPKISALSLPTNFIYSTKLLIEKGGKETPENDSCSFRCSWSLS